MKKTNDSIPFYEKLIPESEIKKKIEEYIKYYKTEIIFYHKLLREGKINPMVLVRLIKDYTSQIKRLEKSRGKCKDCVQSTKTQHTLDTFFKGG